MKQRTSEVRQGYVFLELAPSGVVPLARSLLSQTAPPTGD